jgi:hypothetical protein
VSTSTPRQTVERFLKAVVSPAPGDMADCYADPVAGARALGRLPELAATLAQGA